MGLVDPDARQRRRIRVTGTVQGVGFRPFVYRTAVELDLVGEVSNDSDGVLIEAEGSHAALDELVRRLGSEPPPLARVTDVRTDPLPATHRDAGFTIVPSRDRGTADVPVSVDVGPCADCLAELVDPADRRYRYPFINCTNCGPRYTITRRIPYDRPWTTMAPFEMCPPCLAEYEDPADRRFHAQPNACRDCGPRLTLAATDRSELAAGDEALGATVQRLLDGAIVAVKGVGGFHLAVDATDETAVAELRRRKQRDDKPFALLVADLDAARRLVDLDEAAAAELASLRRPIVLAPRRPDTSGSSSASGSRPDTSGSSSVSGSRPDRGSASGSSEGGRQPGRVAPSVAPGLPELGVMLPPSPLHHLLARDAGRPLVLTSGNLTDEPIVYADDGAFERLGPLVDAVLTHDRAIHIRCDDSVLRAGMGATPDGRARLQMVRRSRGYAPEPMTLPRATSRHLLAVGAELKNTVAVAKHDAVLASHHLGDLEHYAAYRSFEQAVGHLLHLFGVEPEVVAHDLHPEYLSTKFAVDLDLEHHPVQHHHAHIASCLAEHGRDERVLGIAYDGLGWGPDGTLWGGELLVCDLDGFERVAHLGTVPMPGGAAAIREPWRMALAWIDRTLGRERAEAWGGAVDERAPAVLGLLDADRSLATSSVGRLFDAASALLGVRTAITYEGQAAIELEALARAVPASAAPVYPVDVVARDGRHVLDPRPLIAAVVDARDRGDAAAVVAAGFHAGLARGTAELAASLAAAHGLGTVALSGGVFQNRRLTELVERRLRQRGLEVLVHERTTPNDGSISIGQAAIAAR